MKHNALIAILLSLALVACSSEAPETATTEQAPAADEAVVETAAEATLPGADCFPIANDPDVGRPDTLTQFLTARILRRWRTEAT